MAGQQTVVVNLAAAQEVKMNSTREPYWIARLTIASAIVGFFLPYYWLMVGLLGFGRPDSPGLAVFLEIVTWTYRALIPPAPTDFNVFILTPVVNGLLYGAVAFIFAVLICFLSPRFAVFRRRFRRDSEMSERSPADAVRARRRAKRIWLTGIIINVMFGVIAVKPWLFFLFPIGAVMATLAPIYLLTGQLANISVLKGRTL